MRFGAISIAFTSIRTVWSAGPVSDCVGGGTKDRGASAAANLSEVLDSNNPAPAPPAILRKRRRDVRSLLMKPFSVRANCSFYELTLRRYATPATLVLTLIFFRC